MARRNFVIGTLLFVIVKFTLGPHVYIGAPYGIEYIVYSRPQKVGKWI